jgi:hypothetical protein
MACFYKSLLYAGTVKSISISGSYSTLQRIRIHKYIILSIILNGCETLPLTLREEQRLRGFKNKVLRGIFELKTEKPTGRWRKLYNEELHNLYSAPNIIWVTKSRMRWIGHVAHMGGHDICNRRIIKWILKNMV